MAVRKKKRGFWAALKRLMMFLFVMSALLGGAGSYGYYLWSSVPQDWENEQLRKRTLHTTERQARAAKLEERFMSEVHTPQGTTRTVAVTNQGNSDLTHQEQANRKVQNRGFFVPESALESGDAHASKAEPKVISSGQQGIRSSHTSKRVQIDMGLAEVNDWLEFGLPKWLQQNGKQMPPTISEVSLASQDNQPVVMFRYRDKQINQVVSVRFQIQIYGEGEAKLTLHSLKGGELPVPVATLTEIMVSIFPVEMQGQVLPRIQAMVNGQEFDPSFPVRGGIERRRLESYQISPEQLQLQFEVTEAHSGKGTFMLKD